MSAARHNTRFAISAAITAAVTLLLATATALAQPVGEIEVPGTMDYQVKPGVSIETIQTNEVRFFFSPAGGTFAAESTLVLHHDLAAFGCSFLSTHRHEISGDFDASTLQFSGTFQEIEDSTVQLSECNASVSFVRTFDPDMGEWTATLDPTTGVILTRRHIDPIDYLLEVDPALLTDLVPETAPPATVDPNATTPGDATTPGGATTPGDAVTPGAPTPAQEPADAAPPDEPDSTSGRAATTPDEPAAASDSGGGGGGLMFLLIAVVLLLVAAAFFIVRRLVTATPTGVAPGPAGDQRVDGGDCAEYEKKWREARDDCDEKRRATAGANERFNRADRTLEQAQRARSALPSEETRVELPDGSASLSQLDLELRREAAGAAWDEYTSNPSPDTARAAEEAWKEQATPEWLERKRREHTQNKKDLDDAVDRARGDRDRGERELGDARREEREACRKEAEAKDRLDLCRKAEEERRAEAERAAGAEQEPAAEPSAEPPEPKRPVAPVPSSGSGGEPEGEDKACNDGESYWKQIDIDHPFTIPDSDWVQVTIGFKVDGRTQANGLGSFNQSGFVEYPGRGATSRIHVDTLSELTPDQIKDAFSGLAKQWDPAGPGPNQSVSITLSLKRTKGYATCDQKYLCVDGAWQPQREWRPRGPEGDDTLTDTFGFEYSEKAGFARGKEVYLPQIVSFFRKYAQQVRLLSSNEEQLERYRADCRAGRRGG